MCIGALSVLCILGKSCIYGKPNHTSSSYHTNLQDKTWETWKKITQLHEFALKLDPCSYIVVWFLFIFSRIPLGPIHICSTLQIPMTNSFMLTGSQDSFSAILPFKNPRHWDKNTRNQMTWTMSTDYMMINVNIILPEICLELRSCGLWANTFSFENCTCSDHKQMLYFRNFSPK